MSIEIRGEEKGWEYRYGHTAKATEEGGTAGSSASSVFGGAIYCGDLTGKKAVYMVATTVNNLDFTIYGSYNDDATKAEIEAVTTNQLEEAQASTTLDSAATASNLFSTTEPYAWLIVRIQRGSDGVDATYNAYFRGN